MFIYTSGTADGIGEMTLRDIKMFYEYHRLPHWYKWTKSESAEMTGDAVTRCRDHILLPC